MSEKTSISIDKHSPIKIIQKLEQSQSISRYRDSAAHPDSSKVYINLLKKIVKHPRKLDLYLFPWKCIQKGSSFLIDVKKFVDINKERVIGEVKNCHLRDMDVALMNLHFALDDLYKKYVKDMYFIMRKVDDPTEQNKIRFIALQNSTLQNTARKVDSLIRLAEIITSSPAKKLINERRIGKLLSIEPNCDEIVTNEREEDAVVQRTQIFTNFPLMCFSIFIIILYEFLHLRSLDYLNYNLR